MSPLTGLPLASSHSVKEQRRQHKLGERRGSQPARRAIGTRPIRHDLSLQVYKTHSQQAEYFSERQPANQEEGRHAQRAKNVVLVGHYLHVLRLFSIVYALAGQASTYKESSTAIYWWSILILWQMCHK